MGAYVDLDRIPALKAALDRRYEQGFAIGLEEGREEARKEARRQAFASALVFLMERRFGRLSKREETRVRKASASDLKLFLKLLSAPAVEAVSGER